MIKLTPTSANIEFSEKILDHLEYLQSDSNSSLESYIGNCEQIGNLLLNVGAGYPMEINPVEILEMANMNNLLRQILIDFKTTPEHKK